MTAGGGEPLSAARPALGRRGCAGDRSGPATGAAGAGVTAEGEPLGAARAASGGGHPRGPVRPVGRPTPRAFAVPGRSTTRASGPCVRRRLAGCASHRRGVLRRVCAVRGRGCVLELLRRLPGWGSEPVAVWCGWRWRPVSVWPWRGRPMLRRVGRAPGGVRGEGSRLRLGAAASLGPDGFESPPRCPRAPDRAADASAAPSPLRTPVTETPPTLRRRGIRSHPAHR